MAPRTRYARSGALSIAYQVVGDGPVDLVLAPPYVSHLEHAWEEPGYAHYLRRSGPSAGLRRSATSSGPSWTGCGKSGPPRGLPRPHQRPQNRRNQ